MASTSEKVPIDVAIIGGAMGGLCMAIGLLKHPHIRVQIYEAAHKFSEIGPEQAYLRQVTHNTWKDSKNTWFEYRYGMGPQEGELIAAPKNETGQSTVHRAKFLDEFISLVPKELAHFGKRVDQVEDNGAEGVKVHFKDGTTATADCIIGADGVHSAIRKHLLGENHPAVNTVFTGSVAYRGLVPMSDAVEAVGERYAQNSFIWVGTGGCIMTYPIDFGGTFNIVAINSSYDHWNGAWIQKAEYNQITEEFSEWGPHARKIIKLLDRPETEAWSMWDHPPAPTYFSGNIAMMGDAAHASTPFQGQGAGQAIEDAFVLESLFAEVDTPAKISKAFQAYDRIRRPRSQKVCQTSREAGELCALCLPSVKDDPKAFKENIEGRMEWMWHRDIAGERDEAIIIYNKLVNGEDID